MCYLLYNYITFNTFFMSIFDEDLVDRDIIALCYTHSIKSIDLYRGMAISKVLRWKIISMFGKEGTRIFVHGPKIIDFVKRNQLGNGSWNPFDNPNEYEGFNFRNFRVRSGQYKSMDNIDLIILCVIMSNPIGSLNSTLKKIFSDDVNFSFENDEFILYSNDLKMLSMRMKPKGS